MVLAICWDLVSADPVSSRVVAFGANTIVPALRGSPPLTEGQGSCPTAHFDRDDAEETGDDPARLPRSARPHQLRIEGRLQAGTRPCSTGRRPNTDDSLQSGARGFDRPKSSSVGSVGRDRYRCSAHLAPGHERVDDGGMLRELPEDMVSRVGYRIAYGEATRLFEMAQFDHGWGKTSRRGSAARPTRSRRKSCGGSARGLIPRSSSWRSRMLWSRASRGGDGQIPAQAIVAATASIVLGASPSSPLPLIWS
jgi:hypothetical protein